METTRHDDNQKDVQDEKFVEVASEEGPTNDIPRTDDAASARAVLWKLDTRILPILALLFLCSFLDRTNAGNAKTYALEASLGMTDHQYDTGLAVFYATYIASEIPSNLVLKRLSPRIWLPALTCAWGLVTMCLGFVHSYHEFVAVRAILGICEGGLLPGMFLYLSGIYTSDEMALRLGLFYTAASLSGAFGGLLARGLSSIGQHGSQAKWSWIFIVEGLLPSQLPQPDVGHRYLRLFDASRQRRNSLLPHPQPTRLRPLTPPQRSPPRLTNPSNPPPPERFTWSEVLRGLTNISTWLSASAYFGILAGLYSFGLFLPTIIVELGYTANEAQLWSVIPYALASVITVCVAIISDRWKLRGVIMLFVLLPAIIGYAVIANISAHYPKVKYGMNFLMATGLYASVPCVLVWNANNCAGHYKRATTTALQLMIANSGGLVATFIYPNKDKPQFHKGHTVVLGLLVFSWFMVMLNVLYCSKVNRDKKNGKYDQFIGYADDRDPKFIMVL